MTYWDIKLYDGGDEQETIRGLKHGRMVSLMEIFDRLGVPARAQEYEDGVASEGSKAVNLPAAPTMDEPRIVLYGTDMPESGCVQVWSNWPHEIPVPGDRIELHDGDWEVVYRRFSPSADEVEVYADPPEGARGKS